MKRRTALSSITVLIISILFTFTANATPMENEAVKAQNGEYVQDYKTILKEVCNIIDTLATVSPDTMPEEEPYIEGAMGIIETIKYPAPDEVSERTPAALLQKFGYTIQDINADGTRELIIGEINERKAHSCFGSKIYAVYKQTNDKVYCILEGTNRNCFDILNDGTFFNFGSAGAANTIFGSYALYPVKKILSCENFYFSAENNETFQEISYYHNTSGEFDKAVSQVISEKEFDTARNEYEKRIKPIQLIPLAYALSANTHTASISAQWAEKILDAGTPYTEFIADNSDQQVKIAFSASIGVKDFKVLKLALAEVNEDGKPSFSAKELYMVPALKPHFPLVVGITFSGSIPQYGISYTDENGRSKQFAIERSGDDGSLLLTEF